VVKISGIQIAGSEKTHQTLADWVWDSRMGVEGVGWGVGGDDTAQQGGRCRARCKSRLDTIKIPPAHFLYKDLCVILPPIRNKCRWFCT
jgi:hypothetical protein